MELYNKYLHLLQVENSKFLLWLDFYITKITHVN